MGKSEKSSAAKNFMRENTGDSKYGAEALVSVCVVKLPE